MSSLSTYPATRSGGQLFPGSGAPAARAVCPRHSYTFKLVRRDVEPEDRRRDKGSRKHATLHSPIPTATDYHSGKSYSVYLQRYPTDKYDAEEEKGLPDEPEEPEDSDDENEELRQGEVGSASATPDGKGRVEQLKKEAMDEEQGYTPSRSSATKQLQKEQAAVIERSVVLDSQGRLDPQMITLELAETLSDGTSLPKSHREMYERVRADIIADMKDPKTELGKIVKTIARFSQPGAGTEKLLQDQFVQFANIVDRRIAESWHGATEQKGEAIFRSMGSTYLYGESADESSPIKTENKIDILVNGEEVKGDPKKTWSSALSFGEVKRRMAYDLRDSLLGQILRYLRELIVNHGVTGGATFFTLCGPILRLWYADPAQFGTSAGLSFAEEDDFSSIIDMVVFFSGPPSQVMEQWKPQVDSKVNIQVLDGTSYSYRLTEVKQICRSPQIWGTRTAVWSVQVKPDSPLCPMPPDDDKGLQLIIKSTWLAEHLHDHELDVLRWIEEHKAKMKYKPNPEPNIPIPVGHVLGLPGAGTVVQSWRTNNGNLRNSTIASFCVPAEPMRRDIELDDLFLVLKGLCLALDFLSRMGIHYRDLNLGNVLRAIHPRDRNLCVLIDFGHARILKSRRGQKKDIGDPPKPLAINIDDARSGNEYFRSLRIHKMTLKEEQYKTALDSLKIFEKDLAKNLDKAKDEKRKEALRQRHQTNRVKVERLRLELKTAALHHHCADDLESSIYLTLFLRHRHPECHRTVPNVKDINVLNNKQGLWEHTVSSADADIMEKYNDFIVFMHDQVDECQKGLDQAENQAELLKHSNDYDNESGEYYRHPLEKACFADILEQAESVESEHLTDSFEALSLSTIAAAAKKTPAPVVT